MKAMLALSVASIFVLAGCGDGGGNSNKATNDNSSVITAPVDYLGAVGAAKQQSVKQIDLAQLTQAIQMFLASEDRLPKDLNELVSMNYLREIPKPPYGKKIVYDASTGTVKIAAE